MKRPARRRKSAYTSILQIPPELCAKICEEIGMGRVRDLLALCRISRMFRDQAQRLIYHTVVLRDCSSKRLGSWCLAVTRHSQLAERVHSLILGLQSDLALSSDAPKLARALAKCVNLKELSVYDDTSGYRKLTSCHESIQGWIINKCPFRLQKLVNAYFKNSFLSQFYTAQSDIRILSIPHCHGPFPCHDAQLPNLIAVEVARVSALPKDRPLGRIQLHIYSSRDNLEQLSALSQYSATLTTLNILQNRVTDMVSIRAIFTKVAREVPTLLHFGITEMHSDATTIFTEDSPISALAQFTRLETFFFYSRNINEFRDQTLDISYGLETLLDVTVFALAIMKACPTLRRAVVGIDIYTGDDYRATDIHHANIYDPRSSRPRNSDLTCTLTRQLGGEIERESGTRFDFPAASMFWRP
ncbi:hypothetical protein B0H11DRAFT_1989056 [Mycena galericulata]|nr:hypothetical protein B0H11DRAFT_1989056 [Mycena galericulata]